jgi:hypothetical protein
MDPLNFCYWLQGFMEIDDPEALSTRQIDVIRDHLALVFEKMTPDRSTLVSPNTSAERPNQSTHWPYPQTRTFCSATADPKQIRMC